LTIPLPHSQPIIVAVFKKVRFELRGQSFEAGGAAMGQFHVTVYVNNPRSAQLATAAMLDRTLVSVGSDIEEDVEIVTGFVQSIEEDADSVPRRWRITIREDDSQHSALVLSFLRR
jgi:hypothetical protein